MQPFGTNRISSYQFIGKSAYLLLHCMPFCTSSIGASPQSSFLCASRNAGLASTKYITSTAEARLRKFVTVFNLISRHHFEARIAFDLCPTLSRSSIKVPLPGPTSIIWMPSFFFPCANHSVTIHIPHNSPNICDISGEVTKSPAAPNWSLPLVRDV